MRKKPTPRRVLIVTGSRAEFGLLRPVIDAVRRRKDLALLIAVAGEHLLGPAFTWREVAVAGGIAAKIPMQRAADRGRIAHAAAAGRGVEGFARAYARLKPDWVVVLGDRVEAFAAASAASIAGIAVCHIHGGDRAEGIADEAMRHAITKLAHLHCAATRGSAARIIAMGEPRRLVHVTGSPAIDGLRNMPEISKAEITRLGDPNVIVLQHPCGLADEAETEWARFALEVASHIQDQPPGVCHADRGYRRILVFDPNHDPGREQILAIVDAWQRKRLACRVPHWPRNRFIGLLRRLARHPRGAIVGNSSAGLIEAVALGLRTINLGPRQAGREHGPNVFHAMDTRTSTLERAAAFATNGRRSLKPTMLFGDGRAGPRIAALLAAVDPRDPALLRKRNAY